MQMTAREAMHLTELRSAARGPPRVPAGRPDDASPDRRGASGDRRDVQLRELRRGRPRAAGSGAPDRAEAQGSASEARTRSVAPAARSPGRPANDGGRVLDGRHGLRPRRSLAADSIFYVGSIAKQFVAACVAFLERDGALDLDEPVSRYVPRLPDWGERVTIRHLVHHTGGREGAQTRRARRAGRRRARVGQRRAARRAARRSTELDFEPGSRYGYSNRGYLLLAEVVAAASGDERSPSSLASASSSRSA